MNGCNNIWMKLKNNHYLRKLQYSIGFDLLERYIKLLNFTKIIGGYFESAMKWYENRIK